MRHFHGGIDRPEYNAWRGMRQRCSNQNRRGYPEYGGRGITVCPTWDNFAVFLSDMGERPTDLHTIERVDNDGNYCRENCKWATQKEQAANKRIASNAILFTHDNMTQRISDWCDQLGLSRNMVYKRIRKGMDIRLALNL